MASDTKPAIEVTGLDVVAGERTLLSGVDMRAYPGEVTGLIGPNGAGKSTLLGAIGGDSEPAAGAVRVGGLDPRHASITELARTRSVMLQDVAVSFAFLVRDVVSMGRRPWRRTERAAEDNRVVDAALRATGVAHLAARDVMTLSGGERARVALAPILAQQAPIVLLDEPTAALDIRHQEQAMGLISGLAAAGATVLVVLHDLETAARYCDRIVCLKEGGVAVEGTVGEVIRPEVLSEVYQWPIAVAETPGGLSVAPRRADDPAGGGATWDTLVGGIAAPACMK